MEERSTAAELEAEASVVPVAPKATFVLTLLELNVSALNSTALLILTIGPDAPLPVV